MRLAPFLVATLAVTACRSTRNDAPPSSPPAPTTASEPCRGGVGDDVKMAGRTAGAAAKTGVTTAADGVVQAGSSVAGLVQGGTDEAGRRWHEGGSTTKSTAHRGARETRDEASVPPCR